MISPHCVTVFEGTASFRIFLKLFIEPIWYLAYMLQAFQVSRFRPFWYTKPHDPIKSLNCRINGGLKAIYFVQKDTKWVLYIAILNELWKNGEEEIKAKTWKN